MAKTIKAIMNPVMLVWGRETAKLTVEESAHKIKVKAEHLQAWEKGDANPSIPQLRKLGAIYKRPIAVFYLPEKPLDFQPLKDFRRPFGGLQGRLSPALSFQIREAYNRREIALELMMETGTKMPKFSETASLSDDPEEIGEEIRGLLSITNETQSRWSIPNVAFNDLRKTFEQMGVLVFQITDTDASEVRGFSICQLPLPVVAVNRKDHPRARFFTAIHELVHIMLRLSGLCDLEEGSGRASQEQRIEIFCNHVAGAALVPRKSLLAVDVVGRKGKGAKWSDEEIEALAKIYGVSREVVVRRLLILGKVDEAFYRGKRDQYSKEAKPPKRAGFLLPHVDVVSAAGVPFTRLVLDALHQKKITASDVSDYLGIQLKHLPKVEHAVSS